MFALKSVVTYSELLSCLEIVSTLNSMTFLPLKFDFMEPPAGIEPATFALRERRSTD